MDQIRKVIPRIDSTQADSSTSLTRHRCGIRSLLVTPLTPPPPSFRVVRGPGHSPGRPLHPATSEKFSTGKKKKVYKGAGILRPILGTQTVFWPLTPPPHSLRSTLDRMTRNDKRFHDQCQCRRVGEAKLCKQFGCHTTKTDLEFFEVCHGHLKDGWVILQCIEQHRFEVYGLISIVRMQLGADEVGEPMREAAKGTGEGQRTGSPWHVEGQNAAGCATRMGGAAWKANLLGSSDLFQFNHGPPYISHLEMHSFCTKLPMHPAHHRPVHLLPVAPPTSATSDVSLPTLCASTR